MNESPDLSRGKAVQKDVLKVFERKIRKRLPRERRVYTTQLLMTLMLHQFLRENSSLSQQLKEVFRGQFSKYQGDCKRKRSGKLSKNTSALSQARNKIDLELIWGLYEELYEELSEDSLLWKDKYRTFAIDGTTLTLRSESELKKRFPPASNQHGSSRYPVLQVSMVHDLMTGLARLPTWGAMFGKNPSHETRNAKLLFGELERDSVIVGDRQYGIFSMAWHAREHGHKVVFRLREDRLEKLCPELKHNQGEQEIIWYPSATDRKSNPEIPTDAVVNGKVIRRLVEREGKIIPVVLFSTVEESPDDVVALYGRRWEIETDIRYLKTVTLAHPIRARKEKTVILELVSAFMAYNLVRAAIVFAAKEKGLNPKTIGFTSALYSVREGSFLLANVRTDKERKRIFDDMLEGVAFVINMKRKPRSYPRAVHRQPAKGYPLHSQLK